MRIGALVLTCEHGGNRVPEAYARVFASRRGREALDSHRGYDIGSLWLARRIAKKLGVELHHSTVTRLLVELNRSVGHRQFVSEFGAKLDPSERERLLRTYYLPYRRRVESAIHGHVGKGSRVLHLSVHSFTPHLGGRARTADIGILYDPRRTEERRFAARWRDTLRDSAPSLRVRRNYPYLGRSDGLTTSLRQSFDPEAYLGIELEVNQALLEGSRQAKQKVAEALTSTLERQMKDVHRVPGQG